MYRGLIILVAIGSCGGAVVSLEPSETRKENNRRREESKEETSVVSQLTSGQSPAYTPMAEQDSRPSPFPYYYNSFPEYRSDRSDPVRSSYDRFLPSAEPALRESSDWFSGVTTSLIPSSRNLLIYGARAGAYLLHLAVFVLLGTAVTTAICTFTPVCTITFLGLGLSKDQVNEQVAEIARSYVNPDSIQAATLLVSKAIDKYTALQREKQDGEIQEERKQPDAITYDR